MHPFLKEGDRLTVKGAKPEEFRFGDLVVYESGDRYLVHRFLRRSYSAGTGASLVISKADNAARRDPAFHPEQIHGKVVEVIRGNRCFRTDSLGWRGASAVLAALSLGEAFVFENKKIPSAFISILNAPKRSLSRAFVFFIGG